MANRSFENDTITRAIEQLKESDESSDKDNVLSRDHVTEEFINKMWKEVIEET